MNRNFDCIDGNMDVLMYDNTTKKVRDLKRDDAVYAISYDGEDFRYIKGNVLEIHKRKTGAIRVTLGDGRSLVSSPGHQWLTQAGWQFAFDNGAIKENVIYLAKDTKMFGFAVNLAENYRETKLYMAGYIISLEIYGRSLVPLHTGEYADYVLVDREVAKRLYHFLTYFGIDVTLSDVFANDKYTNEYIETKKIRASYKDLIRFSEKYAKYREEPEFIRGFLAGVYDSDGTTNPITKSISSPRHEYLDVLRKGMELYDFQYSYNSEFMEVSLMGGPTELIRFYYIFTPVCTRPVENLTVRNRRLDNIRIVNIEEIKSDDLFEVTTTSRNFFANGIVCHDCITGLVGVR